MRFGARLVECTLPFLSYSSCNTGYDSCHMSLLMLQRVLIALAILIVKF